jgi:protocatechuate 3,4-dioxygenase beta subunit
LFRDPASDDKPSSTTSGGSSTEQRAAYGLGTSGGAGAPEEVDGTLTLEGRVMWGDGRPAEGATVSILSRPGRTGFSPERQTKSDDAGHFLFERQVAGEYLLQAQLDDSVSPSIRVKLDDATPPATLVLLAGASLTVTVVSAQTDRPIPGALVRVLVANDQVAQGDAFREAKSDANGRASFRGLDPISNHAVWAEAEGFAGRQVNVMPSREAGVAWATRIPLTPGAAVSGRVIDANGAGVPGALVGWSNTDVTLDESAFRVFSPFSDYGRMSEKLTDGQGRYRMTVPPGAGCVVAEKPGLRVGSKCHVDVQSGHETSGVDIVLREGFRVTGRVIDAAGSPVADAQVLATTPDTAHDPSMRRAYRYRVKSGPDGRFVMNGLPPQAMALAALTDTASSPLVEIDLEKQHSAEVALRLEYNGTLAGVVKESDGRPVAFAAVNYWLEPDYAALEKANGGKAPKVIKVFALPTQNEATITDAEGRFFVGGLMPAKYAIRAGRPTASSVPDSYAGTTRYGVQTGTTVELVLPAVGGVRGQLRSTDRSPVGAFDVSLYLGNDGPTAADYLFPRGHAFSSPDGTFQIADVPANRYTLKIEGHDIVPVRLTIDVKGNGVTDAGTIEIEHGIPARTGKVVDDKNQPATANVTIETLDPVARIRVACEDDGTFRIPPLKSGTTARLRAEVAGGASSEWTLLPPSARDIVLIMATGNGSVRGVLLDSGSVEDRPIMLAHLGDKPPGTGETDMRELQQTQTGGRFAFENVPPGSYSLWIPLGGQEFAKYPQPIEIEKGRELRVVFDVASAQKVSR